MARRASTDKSVTLADVAVEAGVSAITVSRAIRRPELVSEGARARVAAAVEKLGYVPDPAASALASQRTNVLGLIVPSLTNAVFADVLRGVYDAVEDTGLTVQIGNSRYSPSKEVGLIRTFLRQRPAGLIVAGVDQTGAALEMLRCAPCPVAQIMDVTDSPVNLLVGFAQREGGVMATRHLIACGYRRPAFLGARMDPRSQARLAGFTEAARAADLHDPWRVVTTPRPSSVGVGGLLLADLLAQAPETDAVFCNNDDIAAGALFEAQRRGLRVPEQFGICGFNDLEMSRHLNPALTTVVTPRYEVGRQAVALVRQTMADSGRAVQVIRRLDVSVAARGTTRS